MKNFCEILPKIELHAHLNGSLSVETLKKLGCVGDIEFSMSESLEECFQLFKIAHQATKTKENIYTATRDVIREFADDNVVYLELRTTPRREEGMSKKEYIESVISAIQDNKQNIIVKLILSIDRRHNFEESMNSLDTILAFKKQYPDIIKGLDFSGDPTKGEFHEHLFSKARNSGLYTTVHCGEIRNNDEIGKILYFQPDRIGHATFLHPKYGGSEENWALYCQLKIPAEFCLSSNVLSQTSKSYADHHINEWIKNMLPFSVNTDDKGIFYTCLSQEYELVHKHCNLTKYDLWNISFNAIDHSFASNEEKAFLRNQLMDWKKNHQNMFL